MLSKLIFIFVLIIMPFMACAQGSAERNPAKADIKRALPEVKVDSFRYDKALGLYEVVAEGQIFYLSKDLRYLILGNVIELSTMRNLTAERLSDLQRVDFSSLNRADAIKISSGSKSIAVFTDLDCPFCKKLHAELKRLNDVSVYVFLYPLESIHPGAKSRSISVWCSKDRVRALDDYFSGRFHKAEHFRECANPIERNIQFARRHNIAGVPAIIFEDGRMISGYVRAERLNDFIHRRH